ncbi:MAG: hypothetical protein ACREJU_10950 [Nitrospiraceae bacterium]
MRKLTGYGWTCALSVVCLACAQDLYQQRTDTMKKHISNFYDHLQSDRVRAAILENERLEAMASTVGAEIRRDPQSLADNRVNRDWILFKTANQAAAENWLSLGRYLAHRKRYDEARGAYRRVLRTYHGEQFRPYLDQANAGLQDLDTIFSPTNIP